MSTKSDQLEWRRSKVVEMRLRYYSWRNSTRVTSIKDFTSDIQYLRNQAKVTIREYLRALPEPFIIKILLDTSQT